MKQEKNDYKFESKANKLKETIEKYDPKIASVFLSWAFRHPRYFRSFLHLKKSFLNSREKRLKELQNKIRIPPFLILSITSQCNLHCTGCFASAAGTICHKQSIETKNILNLEQWSNIIQEAGELGVFGFVIAGGEPFLYPDLLTLVERFKDRFFIILTNGTVFNDEHYKRFKKYGNVAVIVSIEGGLEMTDMRRGIGVYEKAMSSLKKLRKTGVINGISVTITNLNYEYWMQSENIDNLINQGIRIGVFIEHIPTTPKSDSVESKNDYGLMLNSKQREKFRNKMLYYRENKNIYIVHSPGDEEFFGGCVSAGRGFAHVTPAGDLTPCPVSNVATHNLTNSSLRDAFDSSLFRKICENEHLLETDGMPCALFAHPKEVDVIAESVGAYRTDMKKK